MVLLDDGPTVGTAGAISSSTGFDNGVTGAGAGCTCCTGCTGSTVVTATENATAAIGATANADANLSADDTGAAASAGTSTFVTSTREGSAGAPGATDTSTVTAAMVGTTKSSTAGTTGTARQDIQTNLSKYLRSAQRIPFKIPSLRRIS